jgi:TolB-like protein/DNA-binding winged helix-turn-helix (wHTH) protein
LPNIQEKESSHLSRGFQLGDWEVHPEISLIKKGDDEDHLEPKAMEVLLYLAERAQRPVRREELLSNIWQETYATDEVLSRIISVLRNRLGDDSKSPTYIETLPKVGYRLLLPVSTLPDNASSDLDVISTRRRNFWRSAMVAMAVVAMVGYFVLQNDQDSVNAKLNWIDNLLSQSSNIDTTLAVLPFEDLSGTTGNEFFAVGLTDEIITSLSRIESLRVVARRSIINLRGAGITMTPAVDFVLDGTVKFARSGIRVTAQLSGSNEGFVVWSGAYEGSRQDFVKLQRTISEEIVSQLNTELNLHGHIEEAPTTPDIAAYSAYLNGRFLLKLRGEQALRASNDAFNDAIRTDPSFTRAYLGSANSHVLLPYYSSDSELLKFGEARQVISNTELSDPYLEAEARAIEAFMAFREWRWLDAESLFEQSLKADPTLANTWVWYSQFLSATGYMDDALRAAAEAYKLDSVSPVVNDRLATAYLWVNENEKADALYQLGASFGFVDQTNPGYFVLLARMARWDEAKKVFVGLNPGGHVAWLHDNLEYLRHDDYRSQFVKVTRDGIARDQFLPRLEFGWWTLLGNADEAFATLRKYKQAKKLLDIEFIFAPEAKHLRQHPEFDEICQELGLTAFWMAVKEPDYRLKD